MASLQNIFGSRSNSNGNFFVEIKKILGFKPRDIFLYQKAFTHSSAGIKNEEGQLISYERLEFLGDAMLGSVISAYLFDNVPDGDEGYLTKMRSKVVSRDHLNELGKDLGLVRFVVSDAPLEKFSEDIHGNIFEALIGAIYLDRGYLYCEKFIDKRVVEPYVDIEKLEGKITSYKSLIIEWCQKDKRQYAFKTYDDTGREAVKHFAVKLKVDGEIVAKARATSKKKAEERAAKRAYYKMKDRIENAMTP